jgi:hypothetical protein
LTYSPFARRVPLKQFPSFTKPGHLEYNLASFSYGGILSFFITFEGTEGCGKTTQIGLLQTYLQRKNHAILLTREPGGTATAEQIRRILLSSERHGADGGAVSL